jgi:signal transduction histidine kinase
MKERIHKIKNRHNKKIYDIPIKHSISEQFAGIFMLLLFGAILLCWFLNSTLLEKYYQSHKQTVLLEAYQSINEAVAEGNLSTDDYRMEIQRLCSVYNIEIIIIDEDSEMVITSVSNPQSYVKQLLDNIFGESSSKTIYEQTDNYTIEKYVDPHTKGQYISLWGILNNGNLFMIRTAMEGIRDSVNIANRFLAYIGILVALAGGFVIWIVSKRVTTPIMELAELSQRMTNLDFDAKYTGEAINEIGVLGNHFNEMNETLEQTISELKTANNELKKDIERKEEIDEMRKEFLSNVSHELKTPIALVLGYAEGLKDCINDDAESREFYCDVIIDEAQKMDVMVKKLLTLNQLEFGNDIVTMERFDIVEFVDNYIQSADILIRQNGVSVSIEKDADAIYAWGDEFKIEEVFMNYFSNAMNHATGEKKITIRLKQNADVVRVSVINTGEPIPEDSLPHLWEKFYKVDKARTREYGGSGVGLSIVKAIMDSMNQHYGVLNHEDGVEFWFELETK